MAATTCVEPHELFNRKLADFLNDLTPIVGHLPEFAVLSKSVRLLCTLDPRKNQQLFETNIAVPFGERLAARDERFFLNDCDAAYCGALQYAEASMGVVPMLKQVWASLSMADRDAVWAHLQVLLVLSRRTVDARLQRVGRGQK